MSTKKRHYIIDSGGSGKIIVLLHGFLSSSKYWARLRPLFLFAGYRVVTIDLLGFGNASKPAEVRYDYLDHVNHVNKAINDVGIKQPFILVGHSMGALIAARYGTLHPGKVSSLVLLHPPLYSDTVETRATLRNTSPFYRFLLDSRYRQAMWLVMRVFSFTYLGSHSQQSRERSLKNVIEVAEVFSDLKDVHPKTLLLVGKKDRKEYLNNLPKFQLSQSVSVAIENVTHHSPRLQPLLVKDRIVEFVS